ncbi:procathepsin L-like isoform X2 [Zootoca vivipara]|nr:cathepsin L1-like [Zootoca vivipara]XP_034972906.1 cathepsin L1-like [Zootoca vivipara]XP_060132484.1 procathepsin L-like isoform X2 [Zootoca vivipara]
MLHLSVAALTGLVFLTPLVAAQDPALDNAWNLWCNTHSKVYAKGEEGHRRSLWESNLEKIEQHNREAAQGKHTYRLAMNRFGDWTDEEFKQKMTGFRFNQTRQCNDNAAIFRKLSERQSPDFVDWRTKGYVTPVKDQGHCGSCWAFSATGALEALHFKKTKRLVSLSEQNLVDCSRNGGNEGCHGGLPSNAFEYVQQNGINSECTYPYEAKTGTCRFNGWDRAATCKGHRKIPPGNEKVLEKVVAFVGPVSVGVNTFDFQFYHDGIYNHCQCGDHLDHAMLAVGYGFERRGGQRLVDYWILKNSWGLAWGIHGYMKMQKGVNRCGIAEQASYPF